MQIELLGRLILEPVDLAIVRVVVQVVEVRHGRGLVSILVYAQPRQHVVQLEIGACLVLVIGIVFILDKKVFFDSQKKCRKTLE